MLVSPSLPAAATTSIPFQIAVTITWAIAVSVRPEPRLMLITPGPLSAAARIPATIWLVTSVVPDPGAASQVCRTASG